MKVTEKQLYFLLQTMRDSLSIYNGFTYDQEQRVAMYNIIVNQMDEDMVEVGSLKKDEKEVLDGEA
jgi:hypothetical protein